MRAMIIEQNTNYAYKLKYMANPTFDKVRDLAVKFYRELPQELQDELFEALNRGIDILDSEPQMTAYLFSFGKMHQAKLNYAFGKLSDDFLSQDEINIIDYGCGQALGTMCYADFLCKNGYEQKVKTITLIEPSEICLKRAALHASVFFPDAEIKTVNKKFDDLTHDDIICSEETPTLHVLSNVLDMTCFDLGKFSGLIKGCLKGFNQFVCVGPYIKNSQKDGRMMTFAGRFSDDVYIETEDRRELNPNKDWTCAINLFAFGKPEVSLKSHLPYYTKTYYTKNELTSALEDKNGVLYSKDGKRLLKCNNSYLERYEIKDGTIVICDDAFRDNGCLRQIIIPDSVKEIGHSAFEGCKSITEVTIPSSVSYIGNRVLCNCISLIQITCKSSHFSVNNNFLIDNDEKEVLTYFGKDEVVSIPKNVKEIGSNAFENNCILQQVIIPDTVVRIGQFAFEGCKSLSQIILPKSLVWIESGAFWGCQSLKQIVIPDSVQFIDSNPFVLCQIPDFTVLTTKYSLLQNMLIDNENHELISFFGNDTTVRIPSVVAIIGVGAFKDCKSIKQVILPSSIIRIDMSAFHNCNSLKTIYFTNTIEWIFPNALQYCSS